MDPLAIPLKITPAREDGDQGQEDPFTSLRLGGLCQQGAERIVGRAIGGNPGRVRTVKKGWALPSSRAGTESIFGPMSSISARSDGNGRASQRTQRQRRLQKTNHGIDRCRRAGDSL